MRHIIHILFILLFHKVMIANDKINISSFSVTSGMPSNEVFCGEYDDLGFLWFGTKNGLSRYDGYSFKNIYLSKLLSDCNVSNSIKLMEKDKDGLFWLITENDDVYVFDSKIMSLTNIPIEVYIKGSIKGRTPKRGSPLNRRFRQPRQIPMLRASSTIAQSGGTNF